MHVKVYKSPPPLMVAVAAFRSQRVILLLVVVAPILKVCGCLCPCFEIQYFMSFLVL